MLKISAKSIEKIKFIVNLANDKDYIDKFFTIFNINNLELKAGNKKYEELIDKGEISEEWKEYLINFKYYNRCCKPIVVDEDRQKFLFAFLINSKFDENFIEKYTNIQSKNNFKEWVTNGIFYYVPPNEGIIEKIKSFKSNTKYVFSIAFSNKLNNIYKKYEADENTLHIMDVISKSKLFDEEYYNDNYQDISITRTNPIYHYAVQGYKEGRNPSIYFNNNFYSQNNIDVKNADVNPLYHFLVAGIKEKRIFSNNIEQHICKIENNINKAVPEEIDLNYLEYKNLKNSYKYLILTHDNILVRTGGIQKVVKEEIIDQNDYLIISPTINPEIFFVISYGDKEHGYLRLEHLNKTIKSVQKLIVHSLVNFSSSTIQRLNIFEKSTKVFIWAHDYSLLCTNFLLLRNNYAKCGAPDIATSSCSICIYSNSRRILLNEITQLFERIKNKFKLITPSEASGRIILRSLGLNRKKLIIRNHYNYEGYIIKKSIDNNKDKKLKIAYAGSAQKHKGMGYFIELKEKYKNAKYYYFSDKNSIGENVTYIHHSLESNNTLDQLIKLHDIDILFLPSQWEETFCLTAYEALMGGAKVFIFKNSGNLSDLSLKIDDVVEVENVEKLITRLQELQENKILIKKYYKFKNSMDLSYAK